jgi:hypothetical protein
MKKSTVNIIITISVCILLLAIGACSAAKFVFLSPACYADNPALTANENYFIKKIVLEAIEDRLSVLDQGISDIYDPNAGEYDIIQQYDTQGNRKHLFIFIDHYFMHTVQENDDGCSLIVRTYGMEESSSDCYYEIHISNDHVVTFFALDP